MALIERHSLDAAARLVRIEHSLEAAEVLGNAKRLQVIIENLLSNALKYTPKEALYKFDCGRGRMD